MQFAFVLFCLFSIGFVKSEFSNGTWEYGFNVIQEQIKQYGEKDFELLSIDETLEKVIQMIIDNPITRALTNEDCKKLGFTDRSHTLQKPFTNFPCETFTRKERGNKIPTNVHELTPADIDIIASIGDSLTAGTGIDARTIAGLLNQYRGRTYSTGGDSTFEGGNPTLANILRKYNPNLQGISNGIGGPSSSTAGLNVALPGDTSLDLLPQAKILVDRMKKQLSNDKFKNSWKLVTVFMGQNDIGAYCKWYRSGVFTPEKYAERLSETLDYLHKNLPRTLVTVVSILDVFLVKELNIGWTCSTIHRLVASCPAYPKNEGEVIKLVNDYQKITDDVVYNKGDYFNDPNFTVVVQPFFKNTQLPRTSDGKPDLAYFAPDCFHLSGKGHAATALALWNSLFQPVSSKKTYWDATEDYECPDLQNPVIKTKNNS